jgi:nucleoside phosphorylase
MTCSGGSNLTPRRQTVILISHTHWMANPRVPKAVSRKLKKCGLQMRSIDFAIITGLLEEFQVLKRIIPNLKEDPDERQGDIWYRGRIDSKRGYGYAVVATFQKEMGPVPATLLTQRLIERWDPAHIILVGIAGSFSKDVRLGDVIVSQQIFYYSPGKATPAGFRYRPEGYPCSMVLIRQSQALSIDDVTMESLRAEARSSALQKANAIAGSPSVGDLNALRSHEPRIHFGTIASGEKVIASPEMQQELLGLHGKILGAEMESAGVLHAAFFSGDTPTSAIMIKGISDHADHLKAHEDEKNYWRQLANENSIRLCLALVESGRIKPLRTDEFAVDVTRGSVAEVRNRITRPSSGGISVLAFPKLVSPKGPLTRLAIEVTAITATGQSLRVIEGIAEHRNMRNEQVKAHFPEDSHVVALKDISAVPIGLYVMLSGTAARLQFRISGPAGSQEVELEL